MNTSILIPGLIAAVGSAMISGLLFVFSNFALQAFHRLGTSRGMTAMQLINKTILNPAFFLLFFGTGLASLASAVLAIGRWGEAGTVWVLTGSILYLCGGIVVTALCNVPLNERLAAVDADSPEGEVIWRIYLTQWVPWNHLRVVTTAAASLALVIGLVQQ